MSHYNIMQKPNKFQLNVDQVAKLNSWLPKGYKIISFEENTKRLAQLKKMQKISYVPIQEIKPVEPTVSRRSKNNVSYYEGDEIGQVALSKGAVQDYQPENQKIRSKTHEPDYYQTNKQKTNIQIDRQSSSGVQKKAQSRVPTYIPTPNQEIEMFLPPVFSKSPLTPKQMLQELEQHSKFYVIRQFETDWPQKKLFEILNKKIESNSYGLQDFLQDMNNLFINIYGSYPRSSSMYNDTGELEGYLTVLLNTQKGKIKQPKIFREQSIQSSYPKEEPTPSLVQQMSIGSQPSLQLRQSSAPQSLLRKKTVLPQKPDPKNITIMDKRILGQNIKKLPNECLPEICRIVYETLETREEYIIDIDTLPIKKVKELQAYVNMCMSRFGDFEADNEIRNEGDSSESSFMIEDDFD